MQQEQAALPDGTLEALSGVSTATLSMQLLKRGLRSCWLNGPRPQACGAFPDGPRLAGEAFTLAFIPQREDLATPESYAAPSSIRAAIEAMPPGRVAVIDARGETGAGTLGDLLVERIKARGG
ncbi:MAG: ribonuclease activity regulator RraA, partial [Rhodovibrionaceae bacterium]